MLAKNRVMRDGLAVGYILNDGHGDFIVGMDDVQKFLPPDASMSGIQDIDEGEVDALIGARRTSQVGKPALIHNSSYGVLSGTQKRILERLPEAGRTVFFKQRDRISINMRDLSALTAHTGVEFSLFQRPDSYIVFRGDERGISVNRKITNEIISKKYRWVGHTHPGNTYWCMSASDGDYETLRILRQKRSVIYNSVGNYNVFSLEDERC